MPQKKRYSQNTRQRKRKRILARDNYTCQNPKCKRHDPTGEYLTVDHIRPLVRGGSNDDGNLHILCNRCDAKKGRYTMDEFMKLQRVIR